MGKKGIIIAVSVFLLSAIGIGAFSIKNAIDKKNEEDNNDDASEKKKTGTETPPPTQVEILKINDTIIPKGSSVNIRKSAAVIDGVSNNLLKVGHIGQIGKISLFEQGKDGYVWYQVVLTPQLYVETKQNYGYVRSDVVKKA